jgi:hypothetical protein
VDNTNYGSPSPDTISTPEKAVADTCKFLKLKLEPQKKVTTIFTTRNQNHHQPPPKLVGCIPDNSLTMRAHIDESIRKAGSRLSQIMKAKRLLTNTIASRLYKSRVLSFLGNYNIVLAQVARLQRVQIRSPPSFLLISMSWGVAVASGSEHYFTG